MFRMAVEDVFTIRRRGTVATGRVESGQLRVGDVVRVNDGDSFTVTGIEMFRKNTDTAGPGETVGILLKDADEGQINRGDILTATTVY